MTGKKNISIALVTALLMAGLTGCGENQIPELSGEEIQAVGEYVAMKMMKYDINHRSRLMDLTQLKAVEPTEPQEPQEPKEPSDMAPVDDTPVVDSAGKQEQEPEYSLEEVLGLPEGITIAFTEEQIFDSYPEEEDFISLAASEGKKLLVLHFALTNNNEQEQSVDIMNSGSLFHVTVNEAYSRMALPTVLLDDLSTYKGAVPAGGTVNTVLVIEVGTDMAENITSVSLQVKREDKINVMKLM